jgi:hypothetical protein
MKGVYILIEYKDKTKVLYESKKYNSTELYWVPIYIYTLDREWIRADNLDKLLSTITDEQAKEHKVKEIKDINKYIKEQLKKRFEDFL